MYSRALLVASMVVGWACGSSAPASDHAPVTVSAAVSLSDVLDDIVGAYTRGGHGAISLNVGGSDTLATQVMAGAPVDVFISADAAQMDRVMADGGIQAATRVDLLGNQLAVVVPAGREQEIMAVRDLASPHVGWIAIGDPDAVPAGVYARRYLKAQGMWDVLQGKIVPTRSVRAALAAVQAGHAEAGFVYRTDVTMLPGVRLAFAVPLEQGPRIRYVAAVTSAARNDAAARRFLAFLQGPVAARLFRAAGFQVPVTR